MARDKVNIKTKLLSGLNKVRRGYKDRRSKRKKLPGISSNQRAPKSPSRLPGLGLPGFIQGKLFKRGGIVFLVFIIVAFLYLIISNIVFVNKLELRKYENSSGVANHKWNGSDKLNIMLAGIDSKDSSNIYVDRVVVIYINPNDKNIGLFGVNTDYEVSLPNDANSTLKLALREGIANDQPIEYLTYGLENLLAMEIHKYIVIDTDEADKILKNISIPQIEVENDITDKDFGSIKKGIFTPNAQTAYNFLATEQGGNELQLSRSAKFVKGIFDDFDNWTRMFSYKKYITTFSENTYTNLSKYELFRLFWFVRGLRSDQFLVAYTRSDSGYRKGIGGIQLVPITNNVDRDLQAIYSDPEIIVEQAKVEVMNATGTPGLATLKGRQIGNSGCRIVRVGNTTGEFSENYIYVLNPEDYPKTIQAIKDAFDGDIKILREEFPYRYVGDMVVVIGRD